MTTLDEVRAEYAQEVIDCPDRDFVVETDRKIRADYAEHIADGGISEQTILTWVGRACRERRLAAERSSKKFLARKPKGFRVDPDTDELRCPHRDISCCDECALTYPNIIEVYGAHYWMRDEADLQAFLTECGVSDVAALSA